MNFLGILGSVRLNLGNLGSKLFSFGCSVGKFLAAAPLNQKEV